MTSIRLEPITKSNWEAAVALEVRPDQQDFVRSNLWTIAESKFYPFVQLRAFMHEETLVGLAAYGEEPDDKDWWLFRFMIGADHQGKGYGKAALEALIAEWRVQGVSAITVGFNPANEVAERLYRGLGFVPTGMSHWGEQLARLDLTAEKG